jgi:cyclohexadienyl dehydratase
MGGITITLARARTSYFSSPVMLSGSTRIALCSKAAKYETLDAIDQLTTPIKHGFAKLPGIVLLSTGG